MKNNLKTFPNGKEFMYDFKHNALQWKEDLEAELREKLDWLEPEEQEHLEPFIKELLKE